MFLRNLENGSDIEPSDNYQEDIDDEEDDDPEMLADLERLKEEILEDFLECAYQKKHEAVEEVKAECKRGKVAKDVEKKRVSEMQGVMDAKRKEGMKAVKERLAKVTDDSEMNLADKIARLQDKDQIRTFIEAWFAV
jgi:Tfp pilus assembly ATPase PilU